MHSVILQLLRRCSLLALLACNAASSPREAPAALDPPTPTASAAVLGNERVAPCPRGRWRLAQDTSLAHVVLWLSQVLIRHADAPGNQDVSFSLADWHSVPPAPTRSRAEAFSLARQIAEQARQNPQSFPELARTYSEEITTRERGGELGGVQAHTLALWPEVMDCIAELQPGDTSRVVETAYGFHVFQRSPAPPEATLSGAEIVIAHDDAGWLEVVNGRPGPKRSRAEALQLANELFARASAEPASFPELVKKYSEHADAIRGGDIGAWSTREAMPFPRELAALRALQVGQVAPPLDSPVGFKILLRTPERPRPQFAMASVRLSFNEADESSRSTTHAFAQLIADTVAKQPARFAEFQRQHCCTELEQWQDGRGPARLSALLSTLAVGQTATAPVEADGTFVVARRAVPGPPPHEPEALLELPAPEHAAVVDYIARQDTTSASEWLRGVGERANAALALEPERARRLSELNAALAGVDGALTDRPRSTLVEQALQAVDQYLGARDAARYRALLEQEVDRRVLGTAP